MNQPDLPAHPEAIDSIYLPVLQAAREAGKIILSYLGRNKQVTSKSVDIDLVTIADKESERFLFGFFREAFSGDSILGEEGANHKGNSDCSWVIDPLDGTINFAHEFPFFCVSIAHVKGENDLVFGLVYNPCHDEMFVAQKGQGAFLNGRPISTSDIKTIDKALLATGFPYNRRQVMARLIRRIEKALQTVGGIRRTGSAALDLCYVASGRFDVYFEEGLNPWDMAAGLLMVKEAGGKVAKFDLSPADIQVPEVLAANAYLIEALAPIASA